MKKILSVILVSILLSTTALSINAKEVANENMPKFDQTELTNMLTYSGETLYVGGSGPGNYTKIQDAIDNASEDDTVFVYSGTYIENILIDKKITLKGEDKFTTTIQAKERGHTVNIKATGVHVTEFTITNGGDLYAGINSNADYTHIYKNIITNNQWYGIQFWYSSNSNINDCEISNNYNTGIIMWNSHYNTISGNGIISNNRGFDLYYSSHNKVIDNLIDGNYNGLGLFWGDPGGDSTSYNIIQGNTITNNWKGISSGGHADGEVSYNIITENTVAYNQGKPGAGIVLGSYTSNNKVYRNKIIENIDTELNQLNNGYDHGNNNYWYDGEEGNYWSDYTERYPNAKPKLLKPWIWNTPYEIDGSANSEDKYPFINENLESFNILTGQSSTNSQQSSSSSSSQQSSQSQQSTQQGIPTNR